MSIIHKSLPNINISNKFELPNKLQFPKNIACIKIYGILFCILYYCTKEEEKKDVYDDNNYEKKTWTWTDDMKTTKRRKEQERNTITTHTRTHSRTSTYILTHFLMNYNKVKPYSILS